MNIETFERDKYTAIWRAQSYRSRSALWFLDNVAGDLRGWKVLDVGCGDGYVVQRLIKQGVDAHGCDITLSGVVNKTDHYTQCPAWKLPYKDEEFELVVSMDVLEHLPVAFIPKAIKEMQRVALREQVHIIATFPDRRYQGYDVHLTVMPIEWWAEQFKGTKATLIERTVKGWNKWQ